MALLVGSCIKSSNLAVECGTNRNANDMEAKAMGHSYRTHSTSGPVSQGVAFRQGPPTLQPSLHKESLCMCTIL